MNRISQIALACACMVVVIHVPPYEMHCNWFMRLVPHGICGVAVPCFFAMSGFFLGRHVREGNWWRHALRKRIRSLLVPYIFWCVAMAVMAFPIMIAANVIAARPLFANFFPEGVCRYLIQTFGINLVEPPLLIAFWYIRALMLFVLVSVLLVPFLIRKPMFTVGALWVVGVFLSWIVPDASCWHGFLKYGFPLVGLSYFSTGIALGCKSLNPDRAEKNGLLSVVTGIGFLVCMLLHIKEIGDPWTEQISIACAVVLIWCKWPRSVILNRPSVAWMSFAIYALHPFIINYVCILTKYRFCPTNALQYTLYAFLCVVSAGLAGFIMHRLFPRFSAVVYGGR